MKPTTSLAVAALAVLSLATPAPAEEQHIDEYACTLKEGYVCYQVGQVEDMFQLCQSNPPGGGSSTKLWRLKDHVIGSNYELAIWESLNGGRVRVSWNNQIPLSYGGVNVIMTRNWPNGNVDPWTQASSLDSTGACGMEMHDGVVGTTSYVMGVKFAGATVTEVRGESTEYSLTASVTTTASFEFTLNPFKWVGGSASIQFGVSGTITTTNNYQLSVTGIAHEFGQEYEYEGLNYVGIPDLAIPDPKDYCQHVPFPCENP